MRNIIIINAEQDENRDNVKKISFPATYQYPDQWSMFIFLSFSSPTPTAKSWSISKNINPNHTSRVLLL